MDQTVINWIIAGFGALTGFVLKAVWDSVRDLQLADKELVDKVSSIEILVAGNYVKKDEFNNVATAIFAKLDRIEDKIDKKADK
jgi:hypothetical protein